MHEHAPRHQLELAAPSNKSFGLLFSVVFSVIGLLPLASGGVVRLWALVVAGVLLVVTGLLPGMLTPFNRWWMALGGLMHRIVSPVALGIVFFIAVLPTGLAIRLFGRNPLRLRLDPTAKTYWIVREPSGPTPESLRNQF